ncbi:MAG: hypothetical protein ACI4OP_02170 [Candidatus Coprovivens sp.]
MKYKKKIANLKAAQEWWNKLPEKVKAATTRPGSIKQRIITGSK